MKICLFTRSHKPYDSRIHYRIALSLVRLGFEVIVICRIPYGKARVVKIIDNIHYIGIPKFHIPRLDFLQTMTLYREAWQVGAKIYICFELRTLFLGLILKMIKKSKIIYDCHEYKAESYSDLVPSAVRGLMIFLVSTVEKYLSKLSDCIWCVNKHLASRLNADWNSPIVLPNYPIKELFLDPKPLPQDVKSKYKNRKVLIYVGNISEKRGISACLLMMSYLKIFCPAAYFLFIGDASPAYQQKINSMIKENDLSNHIEFKGFVDHNVIPSYLKLSDLGVFMVLPVNQRYNWGEPIKYFEYTAAGLPVVISDLPAKKKLIQKYGNGILVNPLDYKETAQKIADLLRNEELMKKMRDRGRNAFLWKLNWNTVETKLQNSVQKLCT